MREYTEVLFVPKENESRTPNPLAPGQHPKPGLSIQPQKKKNPPKKGQLENSQGGRGDGIKSAASQRVDWGYELGWAEAPRLRVEHGEVESGLEGKRKLEGRMKLSE